jgi:hypothetical protein
MAGNTEVMLEALSQVKPVAGPALRAEIAERSLEDQAQAILDKVSDVKGRFAQELAERFADSAVELKVPDYLRAAIEWVADEPAQEAVPAE